MCRDNRRAPFGRRRRFLSQKAMALLCAPMVISTLMVGTLPVARADADVTHGFLTDDCTGPLVLHEKDAMTCTRVGGTSSQLFCAGPNKFQRYRWDNDNCTGVAVSADEPYDVSGCVSISGALHGYHRCKPDTPPPVLAPAPALPLPMPKSDRSTASVVLAAAAAAASPAASPVPVPLRKDTVLTAYYSFPSCGGSPFMTATMYEPGCVADSFVPDFYFSVLCINSSAAILDYWMEDSTCSSTPFTTTIMTFSSCEESGGGSSYATMCTSEPPATHFTLSSPISAGVAAAISVVVILVFVGILAFVIFRMKYRRDMRRLNARPSSFTTVVARIPWQPRTRPHPSWPPATPPNNGTRSTSNDASRKLTSAPFGIVWGRWQGRLLPQALWRLSLQIHLSGHSMSTIS